MYESITLKEEFPIKEIFSIHYFEYMSDFTFAGESHDFWEFLCVDKGTVNVVAGTDTYSLNKGDIIFHKPNEFHNVKANGIVAPNLVVITFACNAPAMNFFKDKILQVGEGERELLGQLIKEAKNTYAYGLDDPYCEKLVHQNEVPFGAEQLIKTYLQQILIRLVRTYSDSHVKVMLPESILSNNDDDIFNKVKAYMESHIDCQLTLEQICKDNLVGRSILQKLFKEKVQCGVINYFCFLKINTAKQLIRNKHMNFTQVADSLGYSSIHYFSRQFKKTTGMTPSEYVSSIKLLTEKE